MESALGAASHFHSGHLTPGSLHKFFSTRRLSSLSQQCPPQVLRTQRQQQHRPLRSCQQHLPASFWTPQPEGDNRNNYDITRQYDPSGTNALATNLQTNRNRLSGERHFPLDTTRRRKRRRLHHHPYFHEPRVGISVHGSPYDEDEALRSFQAQSHQLDHVHEHPPNFYSNDTDGEKLYR